MNLYNNVMQNHIFFSVNDNTLALDNPLRFRNNFFRKNRKTNHDN